MSCVGLKDSTRAFKRRKSSRETGKSRSETTDASVFVLRQVMVTEANGAGICSFVIESRIVHQHRVRMGDKSNIATAALAEAAK